LRKRYVGFSYFLSTAAAATTKRRLVSSCRKLFGSKN